MESRVGRGIFSRMAAVATAVGITAVALVGFTGTASAAPCGTVKDTNVTARTGLLTKSTVGEAHYTMTCDTRGIVVSGRVVDTKKDGHCIETKIVGKTIHLHTVCDGEPPENFNWLIHDRQNVEVYTYRL